MTKGESEMRWQDKLNNRELEHLRVNGVSVLTAFKTLRWNEQLPHFAKVKPCFICGSIAKKLDMIKRQPKAVMLASFPQPKFQIGQKVYMLANRTKAYNDHTVFVVVEIRLSCLSVITEIGFLGDKEPFTYFVVPRGLIGKNCYPSSVRESFLAPVEDI